MRPLLVALLGLVATTPAPLAAAQSALTLDPDRIDGVFAEMNGSDRPGCTLGVFEGGEVAYARGYGMANLEYGIALQPRSVFHIASISKQFTAFAVELLVADGRVAWDDPIQAYVPEVPEYEHPATLRHLAHHTSGVRDQWSLLRMGGWRWEADLVTQRDALRMISRQRALNFRPGSDYLYSNSGFTLLAVVVERVSGTSLRDFAEERIFGPLGMTSTHFHDDHETVVPDRAYGYRRWNDEGWKISIPDFAIVGASSLFTTVEDMARWDRNLGEHLLGNGGLYQSFFERGVLLDGDTLGYAHGISVGSYRGQPTVGHGGADAGYRTNYLRFPDLDIGIVAFCNFARADPGGYVRAVADIVLEDRLEAVADDAREGAGDAPEDAPPGPEAPPAIDALSPEETVELAERVAGFYRDPRRDRPVRIWVHEGQARIDDGFGGGDDGTALLATRDSTFVAPPSRDRITFTVRDGRPVALRPDATSDLVYDYLGPPVEEVDPSEYAGVYRSEEVDTEYRLEAPLAEAAERGAALVLVHRKDDPRFLRPAYLDGFATGGDWLHFERGADGRVTGFTWSTGRVWKVRFERVR